MSKKKKIIISVLILLLIAVGVVLGIAFSKKEKIAFKTQTFGYFDTVTTINGYEYDEKGFENTINEAFELLFEYHRLFDIYHEYEGIPNLYTINSIVDGVHPVVTVDQRIIDMLLYAQEMYTKTGGKMNIAMGSVLSIWHDYRTEGEENPTKAELPPMEDLKAAAEHTDINDLIIDDEKNTVWLSDPEMKLDVGAIAKGYAVEMVARTLEKQGKTGYVINVGGNIRTIGTKATGEKWRAGIENPDKDDEIPYIAYVNVAGEAIVTSGTYQRYYFVKGEKYHHIIDEKTLMPAKGYLSISIICNDSGLADGLSTALFCMGLDEGKALIESLEGVEALWVLEDETRIFSSGFSKFTE